VAAAANFDLASCTLRSQFFKNESLAEPISGEARADLLESIRNLKSECFSPGWRNWQTRQRRENRRSREAVTQAWGAAFAAAGVEALIAPSAANNDGTNVVVFAENLRRPDEFFVETEVQLS
jgi:hypothetical protein